MGFRNLKEKIFDSITKQSDIFSTLIKYIQIIIGYIQTIMNDVTQYSIGQQTSYDIEKLTPNDTKIPTSNDITKFVSNYTSIIQAGEFQLRSFLGKGVYGDVYTGTKSDSDKLYAVKIFRYSFPVNPEVNPSLPLDKLQQERLTVNRQFRHLQFFKNEGSFTAGMIFERVIQYHGSFSYVSNGHMHHGLYMDFFENGTTLSHELFADDNENLKLAMMKEVALGIKELHVHKIAHRDIKPENIMTDGRTVKIIDLGFAVGPKNIHLYNGVSGTPLWMSPEILGRLRQPVYTIEELIAGDIWAFGVTFYTLFHGGEHPYYGENIHQLTQNVLAGFRYHIDDSKMKSNLIIDACLKKMEERPSICELLSFFD